MKKLFLVLSVIGLISLSSCGSQESCRGVRGYSVKQNIEKQHTQATASVTESNDMQ